MLDLSPLVLIIVVAMICATAIICFAISTGFTFRGFGKEFSIKSDKTDIELAKVNSYTDQLKDSLDGGNNSNDTFDLDSPSSNDSNRKKGKPNGR